MGTVINAAIFAAASLGLATSAVAAPAAEPLYKLVASVPLGAGDRWDYVTYDAASNRVFVAHGDHVSVVDLSNNSVTGQIGPLPGGTHGIALTPDDGTGYTDDGKAGMAASFDPKSFAIRSKIPAAPDADGIVFDKPSGHVFVVNGDSGSITVIDPKPNAAITTIDVGAGLEAAASDGKGHLFVDGAEKGDLIKIDTKTNAVLAHFPMPGCKSPHGIAVDAASDRIFATCVNKVMVVVNGATGAIVATLPIGAFPDGAAFDAKRKWAVSPNGEGSLTIVKEKDADHYAVIGTVATAPTARTVAINPQNGDLYLPAAEVSRIDPPSTPGGRPHVELVPGSLKLLIFAPTD